MVHPVQDYFRKKSLKFDTKMKMKIKLETKTKIHADFGFV